MEELPGQHGEGAPELQFQSGPRKFAMATDCQPMAGVANGQIARTDLQLELLFFRVAQRIFQVLGTGWRPAKDIDDAIHWRPREWNKIADLLVNHTMDERKSWCHRFHIPGDVCSDSVSLLLRIDGGARAGSCSEAAWYLEGVVSGRTEGARFCAFLARFCGSQSHLLLQQQLLETRLYRHWQPQPPSTRLTAVSMLTS